MNTDVGMRSPARSVRERSSGRPRRSIIIVLAAVMAAMMALPAEAKRPSTAEAAPPFDYADRTTSCVDGAGTVACTLEATASRVSGVVTADADLAPVGVFAGPGVDEPARAVAYGWTGETYQLSAGSTKVTYTVHFAIDEAVASSSLDTGAYVNIGVNVHHSRCETCGTTVYETIASSVRGVSVDGPANVEDGVERSYQMTVEVTGPDGALIPPGRISVVGIVAADTFGYGPIFAGSAAAHAEGRVTRIVTEHA